MATLVHTGTQATATGATSITTNSPSATGGNKLVLVISWLLAVDAGAQTWSLTTPSGWSVAVNPVAARHAGIGDAGSAVFYKTAAGGVESPVINSPDGAANLYAHSIITEWSGMAAHDTADSSAIITNGTGGASTGDTVPNTGTLATSTSTAFVCFAMMCGTGLSNAAIAFSGGSWTTDASDQNTSTSVGTLIGHKALASNSALGAVFTWTSDSTISCYQGIVVVFSDTSAATGGGPLTDGLVDAILTKGRLLS